MFFRYLFLAFLGYLVITALRRYFFGKTGPDAPKRDPEKEVRNASFKEEDIQDAKFKDIR